MRRPCAGRFAGWGRTFSRSSLRSAGRTRWPSRYLGREKLGQVEEWQRIYGEIMARGECVSLKTLAVSGRDLIQGGMKPGRAMGETLQGLLAHVLEHPEDNRREILLERVFGPGRP